MKKKIAFLAAAGTSMLAPVLAFAQQQTSGTCAPGTYSGGGIEGVICKIYSIIRIVIPVLIIGAVAYFIWGIVQFIGSKDAEDKENARGIMVNGIIAFAVILGLWGMVYLLLDTFGLSGTGVNVSDFPTF